MLWVEIDMSGIKRGPGWVMDVKYRELKSEDLCKNIEELIKQEQINQLHNEDKKNLVG